MNVRSTVRFVLSLTNPSTVTPSAARLSFERPPPGYIASAQDPCTSTYRGRRVPNPTTPRARSDGRNANTCRVPTRRAAEARRGASYARSRTRAARAAGEADAARAPAKIAAVPTALQ